MYFTWVLLGWVACWFRLRPAAVPWLAMASHGTAADAGWGGGGGGRAAQRVLIGTGEPPPWMEGMAGSFNHIMICCDGGGGDFIKIAKNPILKDGI